MCLPNSIETMFDCFTKDASQNPQLKTILEVPQMQQNVVWSYRSRRVPQPDLYQPMCQRKKKSRKGTFQLKSKSGQSEACGSQKSEVSHNSQCEVAEVGADVGNGGGEIKSCGIQKKILPEDRCVDVAYGERHPLQARGIMPTSTSNGTVEQVMTVLCSVDKPMVHVDVEHEISNTHTKLGNGKRRRKATSPSIPYQYKLMRDAARSDVLCLSSGAEEANYKWGSSCSMNDRVCSRVRGKRRIRVEKERGKENLSDEEQDSKRKSSGVSNISIGNAGKNDKDLPSCSSPPRDENLHLHLSGNSSEMLNKDITANEIGQLILKDNDKVKQVNESNVKKNEDTVCCALIGDNKQGQVAVEADTKQINTSIDDIVIVSDTGGDFGKLIEAHGGTEGQVADEANTKLVNTSVHDTVIDNDTEDVDELVSAVNPKLEAKINRLKRIVSAVKAANFRSRRIW